MSEIKGNGGPAFPVNTQRFEDGSINVHPEIGMTLRDYFAAKAMQGMCSNGDATHRGDEVIAKDAYAIADAMLWERIP